MRTEALRDAAFYSVLAALAAVTVSITLFEASAAAAMILAAASLWKERRLNEVAGPFAALAGVYFLMHVASFTQTEHPDASARGVFKVLRHVWLAVAVAYTLDTPKRFTAAYRWLLAVALVICVDAVIQKTTGAELLRGRRMTPYLLEKEYRVTGPFRHANDFSAYLCLVFFAFAGLAGELKSMSARWRGVVAAGVGLTLFCLLYTYSRGAWIAASAALVALALVRRSRLVAAGLAVVALWAVFLSPPYLRQRVTSLADLRDSTLAERVELWGESVRMIRSSPWLGLGTNTYARNEPLFKAPGSRVDKQYAHNGYLQMAAEIGLLGLAAFLAFLGYFFYSCLRAFGGPPEDPWIRAAGLSLCAGIFAFLLHSFTDTNLQSLQLVNSMWMAVGMAWAARRLSSRRP
jgi:putative inorganic carbon (hco3(-)) transporter